MKLMHMVQAEGVVRLQVCSYGRGGAEEQWGPWTVSDACWGLLGPRGVVGENVLRTEVHLAQPQQEPAYCGLLGLHGADVASALRAGAGWEQPHQRDDQMSEGDSLGGVATLSSEGLSSEMRLASAAILVTAVLGNGRLLLQVSCSEYAAVLMRVIVPERKIQLRGLSPESNCAVGLTQATHEMQVGYLACRGAVAVHILQIAQPR